MKLKIAKPECWKATKYLQETLKSDKYFPKAEGDTVVYEVDDLYGKKLLNSNQDGLFEEVKADAPKSNKKAPEVDSELKQLRSDYYKKFGYPAGRLSAEKIKKKLAE